VAGRGERGAAEPSDREIPKLRLAAEQQRMKKAAGELSSEVVDRQVVEGMRKAA
jgi:hypothetical protein